MQDGPSNPVNMTAGFDIPDPTTVGRKEGKVSDAEWALRKDLAATYRLCALYGWTDLVFTHISVRLPDEDGQHRFLINPYGVLFDEMTASSLVKVNTAGEICEESPYFINPAGFTIHSAVHMARDDAGCVIHLHTPYGVAVSMQKPGLRRYSQFAMVIGNDLAYHDYEGIALDLDERERIVADLGEKGSLMLKNHGTLTIGQTCGIAFLRSYFLEMACKTQIFGQSIADPSQMLEEPQEMGDRVSEQSGSAFTAGMGDNLVWPGLMRKLNRQNPGYDH